MDYLKLLNQSPLLKRHDDSDDNDKDNLVRGLSRKLSILHEGSILVFVWAGSGKQ
jgi:hypothetical protein